MKLICYMWQVIYNLLYVLLIFPPFVIYQPRFLSLNFVTFGVSVDMGVCMN